MNEPTLIDALIEAERLLRDLAAERRAAGRDAAADDAESEARWLADLIAQETAR